MLKLFYNQISLITYGFILSQVVLICMALFLNPGINNKAIDQLLQWLVPVVTFGGILTSNSIFTYRLHELQSHDEKLETKQQHYLGATIIRLALLLGPSLLALLSFLFTSNHVYIGFNALILCIMILQKPSELQITIDMMERITEIEKNNETDDFQKISYVNQLAEELHLNSHIAEEKKKKILEKYLFQEMHV